MSKRITIYHSVWVLFFLLILVRYELVFNGVKYLFITLFEAVWEPNEVINNIDILTFDLLNSIILIFVIPLLFYYLNRRFKIFNRKLELSYLVFIILLFSLLFAPIITDFHPNAQPDIRATRFLHPFSSVSVLHVVGVKEENNNELKRKVVNYSFSTDKIYVNKIIDEGNYITYAQGRKQTKIDKEKLLRENGNFVVTSKYFIFGTDELGRDIFARIIYGARVTLFIAFFTVMISLIIGLLLGFLASYFGGYFNLVISRFTDIFLTIPSIFFVIIILAFWGNSIFAVIIVLGLTGWMSLFKVVKSEVASIIQKDYFISSKKIGLPLHKLLTKEVIPAIVVQLVAAVVLQFSNVILAESSLSYLGLGVGINYPSWGNMILSGQKYMSNGEWLIIVPSVILVFSILAINDFGNKLKRELNTWMHDDK